jgi:Leucine-rich repeat (LRR) protein
LSLDTAADVSPLGDIATLERLRLELTTLAVPDSVASLTNLKELYIQGMPDATPLGELTQLEKLYMPGAAPTNLAALSNLSNLKELNMSNSGATGTAFLAGMVNLTKLDMSDSQVKEVAAVAQLSKLSWVSIDYSFVEDLKPLVDNMDFATGDYLAAGGPYIVCANQGANIAALINRGVTVFSPCN